MSDIYLRYVGKGRGTIQGVPARNLTYEEAKQYDFTHLLASGLYVYEASGSIPEQHKADLGIEPSSEKTETPKRTRRTKESDQ